MTEEVKNHTHEDEHNHEEDNLITLIDDEGNEVLFEVLLTIDGQEEFGKNYVLLLPAGSEDDDEEETEISAFSFTQNDDGTEGELIPIPEEAEDEWAYIEDVFNQFQEEAGEELED